jgi:hypothetical protein
VYFDDSSDNEEEKGQLVIRTGVLDMEIPDKGEQA